MILLDLGEAGVDRCDYDGIERGRDVSAGRRRGRT
jgi:hypothetical protein